MKLQETIFQKGRIVERDKQQLPKGVLCRVVYPICNIDEQNQNHRVYGRDLWTKVLSNEILQKKMSERTLFGQAEHPAETQSDLQLTSHIITKTWIDESTNKVMQEMDVLNTPCGKIINTLLEADCLVGVSTRAEGELEEVTEGNDTYYKVTPDSYNYVTTDFTADPSTFNVTPQKYERNVVTEIKAGLDSKKLDKHFAMVLLESMQSKEAKKVLKGIMESKDTSDGSTTITKDDVKFADEEELEEFKNSVKKGTAKLAKGVTLETIVGESVKLVSGPLKGTIGKVVKVNEVKVTLELDNGTTIETDTSHISMDTVEVNTTPVGGGGQNLDIVEEPLDQMGDGEMEGASSVEYEDDIEDKSNEEEIGLDDEGELEIIDDDEEDLENNFESKVKESQYPDDDRQVYDEMKAEGEMEGLLNSIEHIRRLKRGTLRLSNGVRLSLSHNPDTGEWVTKWYDGPKYNEEKTNYTDDFDDAIGTMRATALRYEKLGESKKNESYNPKYEEWKKSVDKELKNLCGMTSHDIDDWTYRDDFEDGVSAKRSAMKAYKNANESKKLTEMSSYTRAAQTDKQERSIRSLEKTLAKFGKRLVGGTTIGKSPQTVVLDLTHQGSEIYVDSNGQVKIKGHSVNPRSVDDVEAAIGGAEKYESKTNEAIDTKMYSWSEEKLANLPLQKLTKLLDQAIEMANVGRDTDWNPVMRKLERVIKNKSKANENLEYSFKYTDTNGVVKEFERTVMAKNTIEAAEKAQELIGEREIKSMNIVKSLTNEGISKDIKTADIKSFNKRMSSILDQLLDGKKLSKKDKYYWDKYHKLVNQAKSEKGVKESMQESSTKQEIQSAINDLEDKLSDLDPSKDSELIEEYTIGIENLKDKLADVDESNSKKYESTADVIRNLRIAEAGTKAEKEKALELLEEAEQNLKQFDSGKALEFKLLANKLKDFKVNESAEVEALCKKLTEKVQAIKKIKAQVTKLKENYEKDLKELSNNVDRYKQEITEAAKKYKEDLAKEESILEEKYRRKFIKQYVNIKLETSGCNPHSSTRALLEKKTTIKEVDECFDELLDVMRQNALHSGAINEVIVSNDDTSPEVKRIVGVVTDLKF